jgi:thiamine biosynthesis lipoprotein
MMVRLQQRKHALGSDALLTLVVDDVAAGEAMFPKLWKMIGAFEQRFSRFIAGSELTKFNARAGSEVPVSKAFERLLRTCQKLSAETDELFNPLTLPALQQAGYVGSWPDVTNFEQSLDYRSRRSVTVVGQLEIHAGSAKIPAASALDFGGIGKGYLLDRLRSYLDRQAYANYWLSLGGDIVCKGRDSTDEPWAIGMQAVDSDLIVGQITNERSNHLAIATSGITKRAGAQQGRMWHHLIDPRTGSSAKTDILSATVVGEQATETDVFAKCLVLLGTRDTGEFIKSHEIKTAYLQTNDGRVILHEASKQRILP